MRSERLIIKVLKVSESIQAAYDKLLNTFAVEPETLKQDLLEYIDNLRHDGLVEIVEP